jgi:hypothetical protein
LVLKEPSKCPLLAYVYRGQQQRIQVIADEIIEIRRLLDVSNFGWETVIAGSDY